MDCIHLQKEKLHVWRDTHHSLLGPHRSPLLLLRVCDEKHFVTVTSKPQNCFSFFHVLTLFENTSCSPYCVNIKNERIMDQWLSRNNPKLILAIFTFMYNKAFGFPPVKWRLGQQWLQLMFIYNHSKIWNMICLQQSRKGQRALLCPPGEGFHW